MIVRHQRRGVALILVLVIIGLLGGLMAVIAANTGRHIRERQTDRVRLAAVAIADSVAAYVEHSDRQWATSQSSGTIAVDVDALMPTPMTGEATFTVVTVYGRTTCRIHTSVTSGAHTATTTRSITVPGRW